MNIGIYAGSIRPGGGLTVLKQIVEAVSCISHARVFVYTGHKDCSAGIQELLSSLGNTEEVRFFSGVNAGTRYAISKLYFIAESKRKKLDVLISINYYIPAVCKTLVYHLNLLSFMSGEKDSVGMMIKRFDARLACRFSNKNVFESRYLQEQAMKVSAVNNPRILYIGIDPQFNCDYVSNAGDESPALNKDTVTITVVSSPSPHKDNPTCLRTLSELYSIRPDVNWEMVFAGGLSESGWAGVKQEVDKMGLSEHVRFLGPLNKKELSRLLNQSLCLINASLIESFCMVAVEAMKSCCPVIVTNSTSMPESVGRSGLVVEPRDCFGFSKKVIELYEDDSYRNKLVIDGINWAGSFGINEFRENMIRETVSCRSVS